MSNAGKNKTKGGKEKRNGRKEGWKERRKREGGREEDLLKSYLLNNI